MNPERRVLQREASGTLREDLADPASERLANETLSDPRAVGEKKSGKGNKAGRGKKTNKTRGMDVIYEEFPFDEEASIRAAFTAQDSSSVVTTGGWSEEEYMDICCPKIMARLQYTFPALRREYLVSYITFLRDELIREGRPVHPLTYEELANFIEVQLKQNAVGETSRVKYDIAEIETGRDKHVSDRSGRRPDENNNRDVPELDRLDTISRHTT